MKRFFLFVASLCLIAATVGFLLLMRSLRQDVEDADAAILSLGKAVPATQSDIHETLTRVQATVASVNGTVEKVNEAADAETAHWLAQQREITKTLADVHDLIVHTDLSVNGTPQHPGLLPGVSDASRDITKASYDAMAQLTQTAKDLDAKITDQRLEDAIAQADGTMIDVHKMADDATGAVHRYTKPPTRKQRILADFKDFGGLVYLAVKIATAP